MFRKERIWIFLLFTKWQSCFVTGIWNAKLYWTECKASNFAFTILSELFWLLPDSPQTHPKCFLGSLRSILGVLGSFPPFLTLAYCSNIFLLLLPIIKRGHYVLQAVHLMMPAKHIVAIVLQSGWSYCWWLLYTCYIENVKAQSHCSTHP